jgi:hypothetical protein
MKSEKNQKTISCPSDISDTTSLPSGSKTYGKLFESKKLFEVGLATGQPKEAMPRGFAEEITEDWEKVPGGGVQDIEEYRSNEHNRLNLKCDYWPKDKYDAGAGYDKDDGRVTLLMPLPDSANLKCTLMRNTTKVKFSAVCECK